MRDRPDTGALVGAVSHLAAVAIGSNLPSAIGDREANLREAVQRIRGLGRVAAVSSFRDTAPVDRLDQPRFLNGALLLETEMSAPQLMEALLEVERSLGRVRDGVVAKGPRVIDLDLLLYENLVVATTGLTVPHPAMGKRAFVLEPMAEIAPEMTHPVLGKTIAAMLDDLQNDEPTRAPHGERPPSSST